MMHLLDSRASRMSPNQVPLTLHADYIEGLRANYRKWYFAAQLDLDNAVGHTQNQGLQRLRSKWGGDCSHSEKSLASALGLRSCLSSTSCYSFWIHFSGISFGILSTPLLVLLCSDSRSGHLEVLPTRLRGGTEQKLPEALPIDAIPTFTALTPHYNETCTRVRSLVMRRVHPDSTTCHSNVLVSRARALNSHCVPIFGLYCASKPSTARSQV